MRSVHRAAVTAVVSLALAFGGCGVALASPTPPPVAGTPDCATAVSNDGGVVSTTRTLAADRVLLAKLVLDAGATDDAAPGAALSTLTLPVTLTADLLGSLTVPTTVAELRARVADVQSRVTRDQDAVTDAQKSATTNLCTPASSSSSSSSSATSTTTTPAPTSTTDVAAKRCSDFATRDAAQVYYDAHGSTTGAAQPALDSNRDGRACEAPAAASSSSTTAPKVDTTHTTNPTADDGTKADTSGSQIKVSDVPVGSVDTGEWG